MTKAIILTTYGDLLTLQEWQGLHGVDGDRIGHFFSLKEKAFQAAIYETGFVMMPAPLIILLDEYRNRKGRPVVINAANRSPEKQDRLRNSGFRTATNSPHVAGMAVDVDCDSVSETEQEAERIMETARDLNLIIRVGFKAYIALGQSFFHVDTCPMFYGEGEILDSEPHPPAWAHSVQW